MPSAILTLLHCAVYAWLISSHFRSSKGLTNMFFPSCESCDAIRHSDKIILRFLFSGTCVCSISTHQLCWLWNWRFTAQHVTTFAWKYFNHQGRNSEKSALANALWCTPVARILKKKHWSGLIMFDLLLVAAVVVVVVVAAAVVLNGNTTITT